MKIKYLSFIAFWLCFLSVRSVNAADQVVNAHIDDGSLKMLQVGTLSNVQSTFINGTSSENQVANGPNKVNPSQQSGKSVPHGVSIIDTSDRSKRSFALSHQTPKTAWLNKNIIGAQSLDRKAKIKQSNELNDLETKRKKMKDSRKKSLSSNPARKLLKPEPEEAGNAP